MRLSRTLTALAVGCLLLGTVPLPAQGASPYKVVVNAANPTSRISRDQLSRLFLKKVTRWPGGQTVSLVDQAEESPVRHAFTKTVHGREVPSVKRYWQQMIFSGRAVPPAEQPSDAEVLAFVRQHPNAIGYVSAAAPVGDQLRVVEIVP